MSMSKRTVTVTTYKAGVIQALKIILCRVESGEALEVAVNDNLPTGFYPEFSKMAYSGLSEVFSWLDSLDLHPEIEF